MHLHSNLRTTFTYETRGHKLTVRPGDTPLTDDDLTRIQTNSAFRKHVAGQHVVVVQDTLAEAFHAGVESFENQMPGAAPVDESPPAPSSIAEEPAPELDPRDRQPGESKKQHAARLAKMIEPSPDAVQALDTAKLFAEWDAMDQPTRDAVYPALTEAEQAAIQARDAEAQQ